MHGNVAAKSRNILLSALAAEDLALLSPHVEAVALVRGQTLVEPHVPTHYAWFVESGIGSIIVISPGGHRVEAGVFGRDGVAPASLIVGVDTVPYQIQILMTGHGLRLPAAALAAALERSPSLRGLLGRYHQTLGTQIAFTGLSNAVHQIDQRCARWLLMVHDRVDGDEIELTHDFLALMLAVRRPSVTTALHVLEGERLIHAERGWITIRDRAALEAFAGDAYGASEIEYRQLIGPMK